MDRRLVLDAAGIDSAVRHKLGWWLLLVHPDDVEIATAELRAYEQEIADDSQHGPAPVAVYGGAATGVAIYAVTVLLIAALDAPAGLGLDWVSAGEMQAGLVLAGQWWRTVTALTLHADAAHVTANLVFGAVFGFLAGRVLGGGVAWLAIVVAGALGNLTNALVQPATHTSIGASTAVFAALGVIVAHSLGHWREDRDKPLRRWSPLIGGLLLLAYMGVGGERTDVAAHVTGFLAGLLTGWAGSRLPHRALASGEVQLAAGCASITIVACAWFAALLVERW